LVCEVTSENVFEALPATVQHLVVSLTAANHSRVRILHAAASDFSYRPRFEPRGYLVVYRFLSICWSLIVPNCSIICSHHLQSEGFLGSTSHPQSPHFTTLTLTSRLSLALSFSLALLARYLDYRTLLQVSPLQTFQTPVSKPSTTYGNYK
jgi:hypothetical protein